MNNFENIENFINKTPKTELHLHIEGSLEPELMFKLSKRNKIETPFKNVNEIKSAYNFTNLDSFLKIYYQGSNVLITEEDFFDLTWEYILRCKKDKIVHTEIFFDPQSHTERGIEFDTVINGINKALIKANSEFGITSKILAEISAIGRGIDINGLFFSIRFNNLFIIALNDIISGPTHSIILE